MSTESNPGLLRRLFNLARFVVVGLIIYVVSMAILMGLRGPIIAASSSGTFTAIFGAWVLATLGIIAAIK
ncbi:hypothetical protein [Halalkalicoccus jeotgali]|uniref:Uncharacterized protein n=1 Tax=Halalkalicoccus jeotgali (strain DSM 18796 / CECT 7217 / JCM 14584 / KCTC 4019 / B3) TaxID=795797 RepID=D8JCR7_HALJB|nr:hypothetical protein [Halalkalicoccus jeotgali]ADJ16812.1 hypothetical protein HacjB3_17348 [Halalkalicoccus jeotgali B3]ADJ17206.1 hypothetical protein HacjB3_19348 [Halalkalicoccus jeotgali B3]ELY41660.1 hypothetical protein C497_00185 [Halalkalicoccus jeotgali B3]